MRSIRTSCAEQLRSNKKRKENFVQHVIICRDGNITGSSEIWNDKLKLSYNKAHGVTEGTEVTQCHGGADGTKRDGGVAYRFLIVILG